MRNQKRKTFSVATALVALMLTACASERAESQTPAVNQDSAAAPGKAVDLTGGFVGKAVKGFTLTDVDGKTVDVGAVLGKKPVVLIFYRGVWCPFCRAQMVQLGQSKKELLQTGAAVYAISNEDDAALKKMRDQHGLDFVTFLSDREGKAADLYMGRYPGKSLIKPGTFVIDRNKKIVYSYVNEDYRTRAATDEMLTALKKATK